MREIYIVFCGIKNGMSKISIRIWMKEEDENNHKEKAEDENKFKT